MTIALLATSLGSRPANPTPGTERRRTSASHERARTARAPRQTPAREAALPRKSDAPIRKLLAPHAAAIMRRTGTKCRAALARLAPPHGATRPMLGT